MGTASSGYGSISESTSVFGETGMFSEPARRGTAWLRVVLKSLLLVRLIRLSRTFTRTRIKLEPI